MSLLLLLLLLFVRLNPPQNICTCAMPYSPDQKTSKNALQFLRSFPNRFSLLSSCLTICNVSLCVCVCKLPRNRVCVCVCVCQCALDDEEHMLWKCAAWKAVSEPCVMEVMLQVPCTWACPCAGMDPMLPHT